MAEQTQWTPVLTTYDPIKAGSIDMTDTEPHDHGIVRAMNAEYTPDPFLKGKPRRTIFIGRLNLKTQEGHLRQMFSEYGEIHSCKVIRDIVTGISRGYAFIEYASSVSANMACLRAHDRELDGRKIFVDHECGRTLPGWIPRRLGGGFGGEKGSGQLRFGGKDRPFKKPILPDKAKPSYSGKYRDY
jgi:U11/U12 small nuclear ribonucleoprotein SNRNP35